MLCIEVIPIKILQTQKQIELAKSPTRLEILRELNKRNALESNQKVKKAYQSLEKGWEGEERLVNYLTRYGDSNWSALRNVWFENYTEFECDLLLFTSAQIYAFEVKNYTGRLELKNSQCFFNNKLSSLDPFSQAQKMTAGLKQILPEVSKVQGVLSFVGLDSSVTIHDSIAGLDIHELNQLRNYLWRIRQTERNHAKQVMDVPAILSALAEHEIGRPTKEKEIPTEVKALNNIRKGIRCSHCHSFQLRRKKFYLLCTCGMAEPWEEAIIRTICEYGVIYHEENLTTRSLTEFFAGSASRRTLIRYLGKHFERIGVNSGSQYINKRLPFDKIRDEFALTLPCYHKLNA